MIDPTDRMIVAILAGMLTTWAVLYFFRGPRR